MVTIENEALRLEINELGAELFSIKDLNSARECLWQGDPAFWKSRSPVLFPIVGALYNGTCRIEGKEYSMGQHGVARHACFDVVASSKDSVTLSLKSTPEIRQSNYPYDFELRLTYTLKGSEIVISYEVLNPSSETIHFQLGAHPGFNFSGYDENASVQGYFALNDRASDDTLVLSQISSGFFVPKKGEVVLEDGKIAITKETFNGDALIFEDAQTHDISLLDASGEAYIRVRYDAPVVGLWSKAHDSYSPFTCIEPWYGRCDSLDYSGEFKDKDWMQSLSAGGRFTTEISIEIIK